MQFLILSFMEEKAKVPQDPRKSSHVPPEVAVRHALYM